MSFVLGSVTRHLIGSRTSFRIENSGARWIPTVVGFSALPTNREIRNEQPSVNDHRPIDKHVSITNDNESDDNNEEYTPWNHPNLSERSKGPKSFRSRQHVNPLSSKFQQPTELSKNWPKDVFRDLSRPLFLDIGCSRGGFLVDIATQRPNDFNFLGLEIRPIVVHQAQDRVAKRPHLQGHLDFVGCNANVDLDRLLTRLSEASANDDKTQQQPTDPNCNLQMVCIQFPDPHFKARHAKRRVVTQELVATLARFMPPGAIVFLQSDVQPVLDEMRLQFRQNSDYFEDTLESLEEYIPENILGIPTEREVSVLERQLPVYRSTFIRTNEGVVRDIASDNAILQVQNNDETEVE